MAALRLNSDLNNTFVAAIAIQIHTRYKNKSPRVFNFKIKREGVLILSLTLTANGRPRRGGKFWFWSPPAALLLILPLHRSKCLTCWGRGWLWLMYWSRRFFCKVPGSSWWLKVELNFYAKIQQQAHCAPTWHFVVLSRVYILLVKCLTHEAYLLLAPKCRVGAMVVSSPSQY